MSINTDSTTQSPTPDYLELVLAFPLRPVKDDSHLHEGGEMLDSLLDFDELSDEQQDYLDVLGTLIKEYEDAYHPMPAASGIEVLTFLMEQHGLRQVDLARLLGSKSVVSEVLRGRRELNIRHIRALSSYFKVPADVFINTSSS